ncbi:hypothetical protein E3N88_12918 [Mikania micrantha]|uniref:Uncharacterized protein n=1 Tax=Mikania micrantha TaxID=192012 RepID=A0A5N6P863_9ASTR|nr:hypothetical protein E3N88_12918 [Mikania micrantha]
MEKLRVLRGTRCLKISEISSDSSVVREAYFLFLRDTRRMGMSPTCLKYQIFIIICILIFLSTPAPSPSKFSSSNTSNLCFKASGTLRSHPGTLLRVQIIFSSAGIRQNSLCDILLPLNHQVNGDNTVRVHITLLNLNVSDGVIDLAVKLTFLRNPCNIFINETYDIISGDERWGCDRVVSEPQRFPYVTLDDTLSLSLSSDSDPSEASSAASLVKAITSKNPDLYKNYRG